MASLGGQSGFANEVKPVMNKKLKQEVDSSQSSFAFSLTTSRLPTNLPNEVVDNLQIRKG
jgi:hypothetical protein